MSLALQSYFTSHKKNLFWMCDNCAELFESSHFRMLCNVNPSPPFSELTTAITELRSEIKQLHAKPATQFSPALGNRWPSIDQARARKRPREADAAMRAADTCTVGSKRTLDNIVAAPAANNADQQFWLYMSRIRPDVTSEVISAMAKVNLEIDNDPVVVKLVPKGKDISTLTFVSFKIGFDLNLKTKALDPETWPEGILFREFEDYGSQKFRVPLKTWKPATPLLPPRVSSPITPVIDRS